MDCCYYYHSLVYLLINKGNIKGKINLGELIHHRRNQLIIIHWWTTWIENRLFKLIYLQEMWSLMTMTRYWLGDCSDSCCLWLGKSYCVLCCLYISWFLVDRLKQMGSSRFHCCCYCCYCGKVIVVDDLYTETIINTAVVLWSVLD